MTITELLTEARAILPGEKLFVMQCAGDRYGAPFSIHIERHDRAFTSYDCEVVGETPKEALEKLRSFKISRAVRATAELVKAKSNVQRLESLQQQTTEDKI